VLILLALIGMMRPTDVQVTRCDESALDQALAAAQDGGTIRFACTGTIPITSTKVISADLTINADAQPVILDGGNRVRLFYIERDASVTINGVDFRRGSAESGGSAINNTGTLALSNSILSENIHALANFGTLTLSQVTFADNVGAGIYNSGNATVIDSIFTGNRHGIDNASGDLIVVSSRFYGNRATERNGIGAGIANSGSVIVFNSTFYDNFAPVGGGAIGTHRGGQVMLLDSLLLGSEDSPPCFGGMIDGGHNVQSPGISCGETIPTSPAQTTRP